MLTLLTLSDAKFIQEAHFEAVVNCLFYDYIKLLRKLYASYFLEPAGEQGVWGLDDFHFLPFLFGASQLRNHATFTPQALLDPKTL